MSKLVGKTIRLSQRAPWVNKWSYVSVKHIPFHSKHLPQEHASMIELNMKIQNIIKFKAILTHFSFIYLLFYSTRN